MWLTHFGKGLFQKCLAVLHRCHAPGDGRACVMERECRRHVRERNDWSPRATLPVRVRDGGQARPFSCAAASTRSGVVKPSVYVP
jgi:hypothetical protein